VPDALVAAEGSESRCEIVPVCEGLEGAVSSW